MQIDTGTEFGARLDRRLRVECLAWLTTTRADGTPEPSPIWFLWDGAEILIYSRPDKPKEHHIRRNPRVSFHFDGDGNGGDIIVLTGEARVDSSAPPAHQNPEFARKYDWGFKKINMTAEQFGKTYSVAIRIRPTRVRGH